MPNRPTDPFEEYGMAVAKSPVKAEQDVKLEKLRYKRAAIRTDVTKKCKLQTSFNCSTDMILPLSFLTLLKHWFCAITQESY